jgi:cyclopropane fatty-acyl-phospholipid synthase-like methyltransferase
VETETANAQHYEVGTGVLKACLGPRMTYSCGFYEEGGKGRGGINGGLAKAEERMLKVYVERTGWGTR